MNTESLGDHPVLGEIVRRLIKAYEPDRIYLFGSTARGDSGPDSDYDLMVVVPDDARPNGGGAVWPTRCCGGQDGRRTSSCGRERPSRAACTSALLSPPLSSPKAAWSMPLDPVLLVETRGWPHLAAL
jgi:hypothetical protein